MMIIIMGLSGWGKEGILRDKEDRSNRKVIPDWRKLGGGATR
jgi:hypothetical protein